MASLHANRLVAPKACHPRCEGAVAKFSRRKMSCAASGNKHEEQKTVTLARASANERTLNIS